MEIGMIGLGRMGANMAQRLVSGRHRVVGFDPNQEVRKSFKGKGVESALRWMRWSGSCKRRGRCG
jgi:6-phosphogluconate dehydrogenase